jgi:branched-chain amino acid aminotransferase
MKTWMDGQWLDDARVPALSHALHYGTGVFEGIRAYGGRLFRLDAHMLRFAAGAETLGLSVDLDAIADACRRSAEGDVYVRPLALFGEGGLGLDTTRNATHAIVAALPWNSHLGAAAAERGIRATVSPRRRNAAAAIPPLKLTGAYVNSILAKRHAGARGFDEAIFIDDLGRVVEATGENVFAVVGGALVAARHPDALPGITRTTVIGLTGARERFLTLDELLDADEIFLTGTSAEVTPVVEIDGRHLRVGPVTRDAQRRYAALVRA